VGHDFLGVCIEIYSVGPQNHRVRLNDNVSRKLPDGPSGLLIVSRDGDVAAPERSLRKSEDAHAQDQKQSFHLPDRQAQSYRRPRLTNAPHLDTLV
jgi:hypothetical protein